MFALISLGLTLSLDNFRISIVLGGLRPTLLRSVKTSLIFGLWDGIAPAAGILVGNFISADVDSTATTVAAIALGSYGLYIVIRSLLSPELADPDLRWATRGLPVPLSVDNVAAGASLGLLGYSPWLAPVLFGAITFVMSIVGHQIGRTAARLIPRIRTDLVTGIALVAMAGFLVLGINLPGGAG